MNQKVKTNTASKQTFVSLTILAVLVLIAGGVFKVQLRFNPAVQLPTAALSAGEKHMPAPSAPQTPSLISPPADQSVLTPAEIFNAATLSDKINGKAELYLSAGFKQLHSQRFKADSAGDRWMEIFVYDMQTPQNAFSVFSAQRRADAQTLDVGQDGYQTPNALFFIHGPFYVEIVASDVSEAMRQPMRTLAETFVAAHPVQTQTINEKALFPSQGLIKDSIALVSADAFGYDRFDQIFTAVYQPGEAQIMAYFSRRKTAREAQELAGGYADFLMAFGGQTATSDLAINTARMIQILDTYEIVFSYGPYLAGVREALEQRTAQELATQLFNQIKEVVGEQPPGS